MRILRKLLADDRGVTTIEYSLLASFIALGLVTSIGDVGANVSDSMDQVQAELADSGKGKKDKDNPGKGKGKNK